MPTNIILTGGINHDYEDTSHALAEVLANAGITSTVFMDIDTGFDAIDEGAFDLVTMNALRWRMLDDDKYIPDREQWAYEIGDRDRANLSSHLMRGGGLLGLHTAAICFDTWPEWPRLLGARWVWGQTFHPPPKTIHISGFNHQHPSTTTLEDFDVIDEVYHYIDSMPKTEPLFSTTSTEDESRQTLAWAQTVDKGRAIYSSLGHDRASVTAAGHAQFLQKAALWCSGEEAGT